MQDTIYGVYDFYSSTDMTFKAGQDKSGGRVAGTPNKATQLSRQLAMPFADEAMQALVNVLRNPESPPQAIVSAANAILDRAFGKPRQEVEHSGDAAQPLEILIRHFTDAVPPEQEDDQFNSVETTELESATRDDQFNSVIITDLEP